MLARVCQIKFNKFVVIFFNLPLDKSHYILDCINAFILLLSTEYELVLGRKGVAVTLRIYKSGYECSKLCYDDTRADGFAKTAEEEGFPELAEKFKGVAAIERAHELHTENY